MSNNKEPLTTTTGPKMDGTKTYKRLVDQVGPGVYLIVGPTRAGKNWIFTHIINGSRVEWETILGFAGKAKINKSMGPIHKLDPLMMPPDEKLVKAMINCKEVVADTMAKPDGGFEGDNPELWFFDEIVGSRLDNNSKSGSIERLASGCRHWNIYCFILVQDGKYITNTARMNSVCQILVGRQGLQFIEEVADRYCLGTGLKKKEFVEKMGKHLSEKDYNSVYLANFTKKIPKMGLCTPVNGLPGINGGTNQIKASKIPTIKGNPKKEKIKKRKRGEKE